MIKLNNGMKCPEGTLIAGTVNPADVIHALAEWADFYSNECFLDIVENLDDDLQMYVDGNGRNSSADDDGVAQLWDDLAACVERELPDGYYFGAHWGDGADWGIWADEEAEENPDEIDTDAFAAQFFADVVSGRISGVAPDREELREMLKGDNMLDGIHQQADQAGIDLSPREARDVLIEFKERVRKRLR